MSKARVRARCAYACPLADVPLLYIPASPSLPNHTIFKQNVWNVNTANKGPTSELALAFGAKVTPGELGFCVMSASGGIVSSKARVHQNQTLTLRSSQWLLEISLLCHILTGAAKSKATSYKISAEYLYVAC